MIMDSSSNLCCFNYDEFGSQPSEKRQQVI